MIHSPHHFACRAFSAAAVTVLLVATTAAAQAAQRAADILPQSTTAYLATDNFPQLRTAWQQTQFDRLLSDPQMQPFVTELTTHLDRGLSGNLPPLGVAWSDLSKIAKGEVCVAQVALPVLNESAKPPTGEPADKPPLRSAFALLIDVQKDQAAAAAALLKTLDAKYTAQGAAKRTSTVGETTIVTYQLLPQPGVARQGQPQPPRTRCYFRTRQWLGVTDDRSLADNIVTRIVDPADDSLAALPAFAHVTLNTPGASDMPGHARWFIEPFALGRSTQTDADTPKNQPAGEPELKLEEQGLDVIQGIGGVMAFDHQSQDLLHRVTIYAPGPLTKVAQVLTFDIDPKLAKVPAWVPADTRQMTSVRWKLPAVLRGYGAMFDALYGDGLDGIFEDVLTDWQSDEPGSPQVDVRKDLLANLRPPLLILRLGDEPWEPVGSETLAAMLTTKPAVVADAVRKMLDGDPEVQKQKIGPHTVWVFRQRNAAAAAANDQPAFGPNLSGFAITVANDYLYVATDVGAIKKILEQSARTPRLAADATYRRAADALAKIGATETFAHQFLRPGEDFRSAYEQLRQPSADNATWLGGWLAGTVYALAPDLDYTKLPSFEVVTQHLLSSSALAARNDHGWVRIGITPKTKED